MSRISSTLVLAFALLLPLAALAQNSDIDKVNGTARVEAGQHAGDVSTVNGAVRIGAGAVVKEASTVNGSVELGDKAQATKLGTVNGAISLAEGSHVSGTVEAVNGSIRLQPNAGIDGKLSNVNGAISLDAAHVAGGIETVNGDITVGANSHVEGGIVVDKNNSWFHFGTERVPHIVIGPHAVVQGTLEFRREVLLQVSDSATIGPVKGASVVKFSGATP